jgi:hypothetical protein
VTKCYSDLRRLRTFEERYAYLRLTGSVGESTFGYDRIFNQQFYMSREWRRARDEVLIRDNGCDLGIPGREIQDRVLVHHMNPLKPEDLAQGRFEIIDPEFLICTEHATHNAIHFGDESKLRLTPEPRRPGDTSLWRTKKG